MIGIEFSFRRHHGKNFYPLLSGMTAGFGKFVAFATCVLEKVVTLLKFSKRSWFNFVHISFGWSIKLRSTSDT